MPQERIGLYYPYVHFRSDEWLKKTLIVFPGIKQIIPDDHRQFNEVMARQMAWSPHLHRC